MAAHHTSGARRQSRDALSGLRLLFWVAVAALAVLGIVFVLLLRTQRSSPPGSVSAGAAEPAVATWPAGARPAPGFQLVDQSGRYVSLAAFRGRPVVVTFIDPLCRNFCPLEAKQLNAMVRSLPARSRPAIIAVSVNVYGDSRANLVQDVSKWNLVPQWRWAVGSHAQLKQVWRRYQIGVLVATKKIAGVTVHEIEHTEGAYVIDSRGYERALFLWPFRSGDVLALLRQLS
jgi:protein SCO1